MKTKTKVNKLTEFKKDELYPVFMEAVNEAIEKYKKQFPLDKVELIEEGSSMFVVINGIRTNEIECLPVTEARKK
jgi:predicted Zn-dependent protease